MKKMLIVQGSQNWHGSEKGQFRVSKKTEKGCFHRNSEYTEVTQFPVQFFIVYKSAVIDFCVLHHVHIKYSSNSVYSNLTLSVCLNKVVTCVLRPLLSKFNTAVNCFIFKMYRSN